MHMIKQVVEVEVAAEVAGVVVVVVVVVAAAAGVGMHSVRKRHQRVAEQTSRIGAPSQEQRSRSAGWFV